MKRILLYFFILIFPIAAYTNDTIQVNLKGRVVDENNEPILIPYRTYGGAVAMPTYDWVENSYGFCAELYEDGMIVYGNPDDNNHEVM